MVRISIRARLCGARIKVLHWLTQRFRQGRGRTVHLLIMSAVFGGAFLWNMARAQDTAAPVNRPAGIESFQFFSPLTDTAKFSPIERGALLAVLCVAVVGLLYAAMLARQVKRADQGTPKMQEIAAAVREGANAYLGAQFRKIGPLILLLTGVLFLTKVQDPSMAWGRAGAFLAGSLFRNEIGRAHV